MPLVVAQSRGMECVSIQAVASARGPGKRNDSQEDALPVLRTHAPVLLGRQRQPPAASGSVSAGQHQHGAAAAEACLPCPPQSARAASQSHPKGSQAKGHHPRALEPLPFQPALFAKNSAGSGSGDQQQPQQLRGQCAEAHEFGDAEPRVGDVPPLSARGRKPAANGKPLATRPTAWIAELAEQTVKSQQQRTQQHPAAAGVAAGRSDEPSAAPSRPRSSPKSAPGGSRRFVAPASRSHYDNDGSRRSSPHVSETAAACAARWDKMFVRAPGGVVGGLGSQCSVRSGASTAEPSDQDVAGHLSIGSAVENLDWDMGPRMPTSSGSADDTSRQAGLAAPSAEAEAVGAGAGTPWAPGIAPGAGSLEREREDLLALLGSHDEATTRPQPHVAAAVGPEGGRICQRPPALSDDGIADCIVPGTLSLRGLQAGGSVSRKRSRGLRGAADSSGAGKQQVQRGPHWLSQNDLREPPPSPVAPCAMALSCHKKGTCRGQRSLHEFAIDDADGQNSSSEHEEEPEVTTGRNANDSVSGFAVLSLSVSKFAGGARGGREAGVESIRTRRRGVLGERRGASGGRASGGREGAQSTEDMYSATTPKALKSLLKDGVAEPGMRGSIMAQRCGTGQDAQVRRLAQQFYMQEADVATVRRHFQRLDLMGTGIISTKAFHQLISEVLPAIYPVEDMRRLSQQVTDAPVGNIRLADVLQWMQRHAFDQEMLVPVTQRKIRAVAREWCIPFTEVEDLHRLFTRFDSTSKGLINSDEFRRLIHVLFKAPEGTTFPQSRVDFMWQQVDTNGRCTGLISFEEFFSWYRRYFSAEDNVAKNFFVV